MTASKFFVTVCASACWATAAPTINKARAPQAVAMMVRICMEPLSVRIGWCSFVIVSSALALTLSAMVPSGSFARQA
jgi:hypothetical protein